MDNKLTAKNTKEGLQSLAERICQAKNLQHVYFAYTLGRRRHYIAGCGQETFSETHQLNITEKITLFWQGNSIEPDFSEFMSSLVSLAKKTEEEFD